MHVYTKSSGNSLSLIDAAGLNETVAVKMRNMGRESSSYLQYILSNYHNLPRHVAFLQAGAWNMGQMQLRQLQPHPWKTRAHPRDLVARHGDVLPWRLSGQLPRADARFEGTRAEASSNVLPEVAAVSVCHAWARPSR